MNENDPVIAVRDALVEIGLIEHGPRRVGLAGAPIASAAPISWAQPLIDALAVRGFVVVRSASPGVEPRAEAGA